MNFIENESAEKLRGGFYTPLELAGFLTRWIKTINPREILEPSCGDGVFFRAVAEQHLPRTTITGFEVVAEEAAKASQVARTAKLNAAVHVSDFLEWAVERLRHGDTRFAAVVGNPPFIRYRYLPSEFQTRAESVFRRLGLRFTKGSRQNNLIIIKPLAA